LDKLLKSQWDMWLVGMAVKFVVVSLSAGEIADLLLEGAAISEAIAGTWVH